ncbi:zinc ribbon domain-containing protein [Priestia koreensis]|nr:zinc ribbon domain-containing protein [Priestia koreensis]UNL84810.1 zinc ribbon domain-containing protein [Priestia koreensis]
MNDLQSKLGGGLNKIQDSLQQGKQKLQTVQEISQQKKIIQEASSKRALLLIQAGEEVYRKVRNGDIQNEELKERFTLLIELDQRIYNAQQMILNLNQESSDSMSCTSCGSAVTVNDKFCGSCGTKVVIPSIEELDMKTCHACDQAVPANTQFCSCCGTKF